ncbi:NAD(P)/FAD-dependent oxidoreductase [Polyangium aurulentum]|uniref:NAD(P)/FAD-dependent oxidoreductase n=1 Tax=Polyangium aurulentum TaxID=2567896 RepID=UPI0010ADC6BA|nr:NAD(P)/FAD-dependent oxidoreductase [Polyangium aurulentum]UQA58132.1 NAD(P)/FAD-dependent oxidoreductase [Polyangium aurulentum]
MSHDRRERPGPAAGSRHASKRAETRRTYLTRGPASSALEKAEDTRPHVVIVGGGFGGLYATKALRRAPVRITLLDRRNHHLFQPLLYQVATAGLNPAEIAVPIRRVLRKQKNVRVLLADVLAVDAPAKRLYTTGGDIDYDILILATGATHSYFGHDAWAEHAPGLKSLEDAFEIRRRIYSAFESAECCAETPESQAAWLTFVVVGGGPTGVELAGTLTEIARHSIVGDFRTIDPSKARVLLIEGLDRILPSYPPALSEKAKKQLEDLGVEVRLNAKVTDIDAEGVRIGDERIPAKTVLWAAGVAASPLAKSLGTPLDRAGRVKVEQDLTVPGHPEIYVIGDLASIMTDGQPVPGVAPAAIQEARHTAANIRRSLAGQERLPFRYHDKGSLATIGRARGVADLGRIKLSGFVAWFAWLVIHVFFLIGFRNRFLVLFDWAWSYLTYERGARLITGDPPARALPPAHEDHPQQS